MVSLGFGALEGPAKEGASIWHAREKCPILAQRFLEHRFFEAVHTEQGCADLHNIYRCQPFTFTLGCLCAYEVYLFLGNLELPVALSKIRPFPSLFYLYGPYFAVLTLVSRRWLLILTGAHIYCLKGLRHLKNNECIDRIKAFSQCFLISFQYLCRVFLGIKGSLFIVSIGVCCCFNFNSLL